MNLPLWIESYVTEHIPVTLWAEQDFAACAKATISNSTSGVKIEIANCNTGLKMCELDLPREMLARLLGIPLRDDEEKGGVN